MVRINLGVVLGGLAAVHIAATTAAGGLVTFEFAGEITTVSDVNDLTGGSVIPGTRFSGAFTFESATPDSNADPRRGVYEDAVTSLSGEVGGLPFTGPEGGPMGVWVDDELSVGDLYLVEGEVAFASNTLDFIIGLGAASATALPSDALLLSPPELSAFDFANFEIWDGSEGLGFALVGQITVFTPEPHTLVLLALGSVGFAVLRGSRRSQR